MMVTNSPVYVIFKLEDLGASERIPIPVEYVSNKHRAESIVTSRNYEYGHNIWTYNVVNHFDGETSYQPSGGAQLG